MKIFIVCNDEYGFDSFLEVFKDENDAKNFIEKCLEKSPLMTIDDFSVIEKEV